MVSVFWQPSTVLVVASLWKQALKMAEFNSIHTAYCTSLMLASVSNKKADVSHVNVCQLILAALTLASWH